MLGPWETVEMQEGGSSHLVVSCWWSNALSFKPISHAALQSLVTKKPASYIDCFLRTWHSARHSGGLTPTSQHHWIGDMNFGKHKQNFSLSLSPLPHFYVMEKRLSQRPHRFPGSSRVGLHTSSRGFCVSPSQDGLMTQTDETLGSWRAGRSELHLLMDCLRPH